MKVEMKTFGEFATFRYGKMPIKNKISEHGKYPVFSGYRNVGFYDEFNTTANTLVIVARGVGGTGDVKLTKERCYLTNLSIAVSIDELVALPEYLYYYFSANSLRYLDSGSAQSQITINDLSKVLIPIPAVEDQRRICLILHTLDEKIALNTQMNDNLLQQAQSIYHSWFVDYGPFGDKKPSNWMDGTITDLAKEIICGKTPSTKKSEYYGKDIPFITIPDMHGKVYTVTTERYLSALGVKSQPGKVLCKNSVCVSCIGTAGLVTLVATTSQTNQQINSIIPKDGYSPYYIYLLMQTLSETINKLGQSGSTIVNLNKAQFSKIKVIIPPVEVMKSLDNILMPIFELILAHQKENIRLASLRDALLPRLMSGELNIKDMDI